MGKRKRKDLDRELRRLRRKLDKLANQKNKNESTRDKSPDIPPENISPECLTPEPAVENPEMAPPEIAEPEIDCDILTAMGVIEEDPINGPPIHKEIAQRWATLLTKGLKKEDKTELTKQYSPFSNVPAMTPPKLNPELAAAVTEPVKKRDTVIENKQKELAVALSAIGLGLQCFLTKGSKVDGIKHFNDAAKIMCDIFHGETASRRYLIQKVINKDMKGSLLEEANEFLFGNTLSERIKTTKAVQRSAQELANKNVPFKSNTNNKTSNTNKSLNWRAPPQPSFRQNRQNNTNKQSSGGVKKRVIRQDFKKGQPKHQQHHGQRK